MSDRSVAPLGFGPAQPGRPARPPSRAWAVIPALIAVLAASSPAFAAPPEDLILCQSPGITDGDTFRCDGALKIRLWGVNAPERDAPGGLAATRALAALTQGQTVVCRRRGKSYDRIVAQCWVGRDDVAAQLVRQGHATDWPKFSRGHYGRPRP